MKKSDLYSSLWSSCDELRGGMDASQYKDYVLTLLFMKYVSDKYAGKPDALIEIPKGGSFADMIAAKGDKEIGDRINKVIGKLAEANDLLGVINVADFNDEDKLGKGQEMQDRLSKLVGIFESLDFRANRAEGDDLLGDAYEYLMRHFATESGKSKGQFYTPAEVSRIMAKVIGISSTTRQDQTIYDPTCGSGSLLLKAADESPHGLTIYGQENDVATWALAKMNMILHGHPTAELHRGNTLSAPFFKNKDDSLKTFDFAVANPPFSAKAWTNGLNPLHDQFHRFEYGIPPAKNGDFAFLLHVVSSLKSTGKAAVILPHGVLFRGNKEADIRRNLIKRGLIKGIVGLPPNLFYGTSIAACIVVIDKENAATRSAIFLIDASKGFIKDANKNRLRAQDIHRIVDVFNNQTEIDGYSRKVSVDEIASAANDYNLNIPRYIDSSAPEDLQDLDAHLRGGIPNRDIDALDAYWAVFPDLRDQLFAPAERPGYSCAKVETHKVKTRIRTHPEFKTYSAMVESIFDGWAKSHGPSLKEVKAGTKPKDIVGYLSEDLLARFAKVALLSKYTAYQRLMDYWSETMQDDIYLIAADGWAAASRPRATIEDKERKVRETPDLTVGRKKYKMDLIPPALVAARFFSASLATQASLVAKAETAARNLMDFLEENASEDGPLEDAKNDNGEITKAALKEAIKTFKDLPDSDKERATLAQCASLFQSAGAANQAVKDAKSALDAEVLARYDELTEDEIKSLVVNDKWLLSIGMALREEVDRLSTALAKRIQDLEQRYAEPLPNIERELDSLNERVESHLKQMGLLWK